MPLDPQHAPASVDVALPARIERAPFFVDVALERDSFAQIPALVQAGYRVIAPDLKGYGESGKPQDPSLYVMPNLLQDVLGILDQLHVAKVFCVVGHDWGSAVAWQLAGRFPNRFERLVALSVGHNASMFSIGGNKQREKSWYMLFFKVHISS